MAQAEQYVERRLAALQSTPPAGRKTYIIKDVRLFLNSLDRGLRLIREAGVDARTERQETGGGHPADHPHPQTAPGRLLTSETAVVTGL